MKNVQKACLSDIAGNMNCSHCGSTMSTVEYFTAHPASQVITNQTLDSKTVTTTFDDVGQHIGSICVTCVHRERAIERIIGLVLLIGGGILSGVAMMTGLVLYTIAERDGKGVGAVIGTPMMLLTVVLLLEAIAGLCIFLDGNAYNPKKFIIPERLFLLYTKRLKKENPTDRVVYLTPALAAQFEKK